MNCEQKHQSVSTDRFQSKKAQAMKYKKTTNNAVRTKLPFDYNFSSDTKRK
jgi:hypothetical protein